MQQKQPFKNLEIPGGGGWHQNTPWNGKFQGGVGTVVEKTFWGGYGHFLVLHIVKQQEYRIASVIT